MQVERPSGGRSDGTLLVHIDNATGYMMNNSLNCHKTMRILLRCNKPNLICSIFMIKHVLLLNAKVLACRSQLVPLSAQHLQLNNACTWVLWEHVWGRWWGVRYSRSAKRSDHVDSTKDRHTSEASLQATRQQYNDSTPFSGGQEGNRLQRQFRQNCLICLFIKSQRKTTLCVWWY